MNLEILIKAKCSKGYISQGPDPPSPPKKKPYIESLENIVIKALFARDVLG